MDELYAFSGSCSSLDPDGEDADTTTLQGRRRPLLAGCPPPSASGFAEQPAGIGGSASSPSGDKGRWPYRSRTLTSWAAGGSGPGRLPPPQPKIGYGSHSHDVAGSAPFFL